MKKGINSKEKTSFRAKMKVKGQRRRRKRLKKKRKVIYMTTKVIEIFIKFCNYI